MGTAEVLDVVLRGLPEWSGADAAGLVVRKMFRFDPQAYVVTFDANVSLGEYWIS